MTAVLADADDTVSVLVVAKDPISHAGVERQLHAIAGVSLLTRAQRRQPDVALVIASAIDAEVLGWIRTIRRHWLSRIVLIADVADPSSPECDAARAAGAAGVLPRAQADGRRLAGVIHRAHRGEPLLTAAADTTDAAPLSGPEPASVGTEGSTIVSDRDRQVLKLLAEGYDTGEIARAIAYSEPTIKNAIQKIFEQLKAKNRQHAVALALRAGII